MRIALERAPTHLKARAAAGDGGPLPNLAVPFLRCVGERAAGLQWNIRNADLILHEPFTVTEFKETARRALAYDELLSLLSQISVVDEITIYAGEYELSDDELNDKIEHNEYSAFKICIDLWDSSEWTFASKIESEISCAVATIQDHADEPTQ